MYYDFNEPIDRRGSHCVKIERMKDIWNRTDLLPLWVADMDFKTPPPVVEALKKRMQHELFGYTCPHEGYFNAIVQWVQKRYGMELSREHIQFFPGIVPGIHMVVNALTEKGDKVMIQPPVYHPFRQIIEGTGRVVVSNPLQLIDGRFSMDFAQMREAIKGCKLFILCYPHNPGGTVWKREELEELARVCAEEGVIVLSDEMHADLTLPPLRHLPFAMVSETAKQNSLTFMSAAKAFNIAGLAASHVLVFNDLLRKKLFHYIRNNGLDLGNAFGYLAVEAAYTYGEEWLNQLLLYLKGNINFVDHWLYDLMPKIKVMRPEASFLIFLDCRELGLSTQELDDFFVNKAQLALNSGAMFGVGGEGFMRMNIAVPMLIIRRAVTQLQQAYWQITESR